LSTPCDTRELDRAIALQLGQQRPSDKCQACLPDNSAPGQWEEHGASREQHPARTTIGRGWEGSDSASRRSCWSCRC
jgi:hypothetical protein